MPVLLLGLQISPKITALINTIDLKPVKIHKQDFKFLAQVKIK